MKAARSIHRVSFRSTDRRAPAKVRVPRVAERLALAHKIEGMIRAGALRDRADAARAMGLTRARVTQIANLLLLAPAIQEAILELPPVTVGRDPVSERTLRKIVAGPNWERQVATWSRLIANLPQLPRRPGCKS